MPNETSTTILCIDDDRGALDYHRALLERSGYSVLTASSVRRGLEIARTSAITLVLVDYHMPEMTGDEVAAAIKHMKPKIPVLLVSSDDKIPVAALRIVDGFVSKNEAGHLLVPTILSFCAGNSPALQTVAVAANRV
jgi:CheY-like chemotaxis protein